LQSTGALLYYRDMETSLILKFDAEETMADEALYYLKATKWHSQLSEIDNFCRSKIKYQEDLDEKTVEILSEIRQMIDLEYRD